MQQKCCAIKVLLHIYAHTLAKALYSRILMRLSYICNAAIQTSELCIIPCVYDLSSKRGGSYAEAAVPHNSFKPLVCRLDQQVSSVCKYIRNRSLGKRLSFRAFSGSVYDTTSAQNHSIPSLCVWSIPECKGHTLDHSLPNVLVSLLLPLCIPWRCWQQMTRF